MSKQPVFVALDLGGTKIRGGLFDGGNTCIGHKQVPANAAGGRDTVLAALESLTADLLQEARVAELPVAAIGVSSAGVIDPVTGVVLDATDSIPGWKGTDIAGYLQGRFDLPVAVENDVKAALLGELNAAGGTADPAERTVMLTLGTGLGGAVSEGGVIVAGRNHVAGHFGRLLVPDPREAGAFAPLESSLSGTGLMNTGNRIAQGERFVSGRHVLQSTHKGDAIATAAVTQFCKLLALTVHNVYWALDPDRVIIGGGLVESNSDWWSQFIGYLAQHKLPVKVEQAHLGNDAGIYGAARIARMHVAAGAELPA
ncbi:ROK family protein [Biformimicrobium ophioploci]|uniref:ROK family protein n=1 Tax=Biformimicrobium ophioploci TaxID=3036711 RepID=A0ABQ6LWM5_9GAMM|nr:ROK family protein [Microbulbifer sp. NKW57]GMG86465.1 ROK family protein [Microbulbifer sp. NKW57]